MATKFLILNIDDAIFAPLVDYIYQSNRGHQGPRPGGRRFQLGAPGNVVRQLLWVTADDGRRPQNGLFDAMQAAGHGEVVVSATHNNVLAALQDGDQIYICVHGQYRGVNDTATNRIIVDNAVLQRAPLDPAAFAGHLTNVLGLPNRRLHLKVFACYSGKGRGDLRQLADIDEASLKVLFGQSFAGLLRGNLSGTHPQLTVSGYVGATRLPSSVGKNKKMGFGVGHDRHRLSAKDFRVTFAPGIADAILPGGWEGNWAM